MTDLRPDTEPVPWTGRDIAFALFFIYAFWQVLALQVLLSTGLAERIYGPDVAALYQPRDSADPADKDRDHDPDARRLRTRLNLWTMALAFPFQAATIPTVFYLLSGVRPGRIGLTRRRLGRNVLAGVVAWVVITPLVFGVNLLVLYLHQQFDPGAVQDHPLTQLARGQLSGAEWFLLVFSAVVAAPVLEELIFRGALQPWFAAMRGGGAIALAAAFTLAAWQAAPRLIEAIRHGGDGWLSACLPPAFVLVLTPPFLLISRRPPYPDAPAVFGTAVLFAAVHSNVWPSPVALFVLGLALGTLAARTRSLVGPIVLHALFNGVTCLMLLMGWG